MLKEKVKDNTGDEVRSNKWGGREKENRKQPLKTKQEKRSYLCNSQKTTVRPERGGRVGKTQILIWVRLQCRNFWTEHNIFKCRSCNFQREWSQQIQQLQLHPHLNIAQLKFCKGKCMKDQEKQRFRIQQPHDTACTEQFVVVSLK